MLLSSWKNTINVTALYMAYQHPYLEEHLF